MDIYEIRVRNHWEPIVTACVNGEEKEAIASMEKQMERMGYPRVEAVAIRRMNESYGNGGYGLIAVEDFHAVQ